MIKSGFSVIEFTKSMLYSCIKVVRLKPEQPNSGYGPVLPYALYKLHKHAYTCRYVKCSLWGVHRRIWNNTYWPYTAEFLTEKKAYSLSNALPSNH